MNLVLDGERTFVDVRVLRSTATACSCEDTSSMVFGRLGRISDRVGTFTRNTRYFSTQGCNVGSATVFVCAEAFCGGFRNILYNQPMCKSCSNWTPLSAVETPLNQKTRANGSSCIISIIIQQNSPYNSKMYKENQSYVLVQYYNADVE